MRRRRSRSSMPAYRSRTDDLCDSYFMIGKPFELNEGAIVSRKFTREPSRRRAQSHYWCLNGTRHRDVEETTDGNQEAHIANLAAQIAPGGRCDGHLSCYAAPRANTRATKDWLPDSSYWPSRRW